ncbi:MAG: tetratricopeptide repeat protein [Myxococcota bacterium]
MLRFLLLTSALLAAAPLGAAMAQEPGDESEDQEARALFEAGRTAFEAGRFEAALRHFEASYELSGHPQLLYNIGTTADRLRMDDEALAAFQEYLERVPDAPNRGEVVARVRVLERASQGDRAAPPPEEEPASEASEESSPAPSPDEAAREAGSEPESKTAGLRVEAGTGTPEGQEDRDGGGVASKWWFWTILGAVAVGGVVTGVVLAGDDGGGSGGARVPEGDTGGAVITLGAH